MVVSFLPSETSLYCSWHKMKVLTAEDVASLINDSATVISGGFGSCGHPDMLTTALQQRYLQTSSPSGITLIFAAGQGDKAGKGLDRLAEPGLVAKAIGGFWGLCPRLANLATSGKIEAHDWPQGIMSKLFSIIASGSPGILSKVGIGTFVDPLIDGGVINSNTKPLVRRIHIDNKGDYLFYPSLPVDFTLIRGTTSDQDGNISLEAETSYMDVLAQAQAAKTRGGRVAVQVKSLVARGAIKPYDVRIPGFLVDYVVLAKEKDHPQTYGTHFNPSYTTYSDSRDGIDLSKFPIAKRIIAARAAVELSKHPGSNVNLGIGIPALVGAYAQKLGIRDFTLTVESGTVGGTPDEGLSFGASIGPTAIIEQSALFDFYDGGGLDVAFLGFGEIDLDGNVNVSRLGNKFTGAGGFINISQNAKKIVFCGTLTADGGEVEIRKDGTVSVIKKGKIRKIVEKVNHLTFNARRARESNIEVMYITELAAFSLTQDGLTLVEIAAGISPDDLNEITGFKMQTSSQLKVMEYTI